MKDSRGFTMIEMVVVLAVIAILAAVLTPIVTSYVEKARVNTATNDVKKIAAAVIQFNTDTKVWPIYTSTSFPTEATGVNSTVFDFAATTGNDAIVPTTGSGHDWPIAGGTPGDLNAIVNQNAMDLALTGNRAWHVAYSEMGEDPWGTKYYINAKFLKPGASSTHGSGGTATPTAVYIISAGPDQTLNTDFDQATNAFVPSG